MMGWGFNHHYQGPRADRYQDSSCGQLTDRRIATGAMPSRLQLFDHRQNMIAKSGYDYYGGL